MTTAVQLTNNDLKRLPIIFVRNVNNAFRQNRRILESVLTDRNPLLILVKTNRLKKVLHLNNTLHLYSTKDGRTFLLLRIRLFAVGK